MRAKSLMLPRGRRLRGERPTPAMGQGYSEDGVTQWLAGALRGPAQPRKRASSRAAPAWSPPPSVIRPRRETRPLLRASPPASLSSLLTALARAGRRPSAPWLAAAQDALAGASPAPPIDVWAAALAALARLGPVERPLAAALMAATAPALPSAAPPPALSQLLWGVAKARLAPPAGWLAALGGALAARAPELTSVQAACCLRSLAVMAERAPEAELRRGAAALAARLAAAPEGAGPGDLAQALWALAR
jgi:hypothetical protein